jgi:putative ABC transport system permease protein
MTSLNLATRLLRRNWRAGESRVLLFALFIAVASVTTVGFFADRVRAALDRQANELMGGDLVVISDHALGPAFSAAASGENLATAHTRTFPSMVSGSAGVNLAEIKAVSEGFPLRGKIRIADAPGLPDREAEGVPAAGTAWVGEPLLARIGAGPGEAIRVGKADLKIAAIVVREPDSVLDYFGIAPRVLINERDLDATGLVVVGSRVTWRLLVSGEPDAIDRYREAMLPKLGRGERIESVRDARSEVRVSLDRARRFLALASLLSVVLSSVAVALAARRFSQRQMDGAAMMRCLGASQASIFAINAWQFLLLGLAGSALGTAFGYFAQEALAIWLADFFKVSLPSPGPLPAVQGAAIGFVLLLGFTLPPLLRLRSASTLRVLRRDLDIAEPSALGAYALGLAVLAGLILWQVGDLALGSQALAGFAATIGVAAVAGLMLVRGVSALRGSASGPWRYGLANLRRRTGSSVVQIIALGLGIMAMLMLTLVRTDMIGRWQKSLPADMPNRFAINIQTDQLPGVQAWFRSQALATPDLYPMVRGRLMTISDRPVKPAEMKDERAKRQAERELNLSWAEKSRPDNAIVAGTFWKPGDRDPQFSVEEGFAKSLGIKVGDTLGFDVGGSRFTGKVTSLRKVDWDSFKANFFVIANPGVLESYPASWITSFHLPPGREATVNALVREYSNVSVIDLSAIMEQVRRITDQVSRAVEFVFLFAIAAGIVVLFAAITSTQDERVFEGAVMRTLGASRRQLVTLQFAEFLAIGTLSGVIAALGAVALAYALSERLLGVPYEFNALIPLAGMAVGAIGVAVAGLLGTRRAIDSPPLATIRAVA